MLVNHDPFVQIKLDEIRETVYSYDQDDKNTEANRNSEFPGFMPRTMPDDEILESIRFCKFLLSQ